ncbi:MAG TPA: glycosyl hydrolase family 28 protein [Verrucomicrobiales bacterium]|nr:glycosyl hydrolase family 28 protein [Verrucomicrobiales bacterium]
MSLFRSLSLPVAGFIACCLLAPGAVASAPATVPGVISDRFEVRAGEVNVPVIAYKDVHYAAFPFVGPIEIEVRAKDGPVAVARVQPGAYGLGPQVEGATVRFSIPRPMALVVQLDYREKLFLFADPPPDPVPADAVDAVSLGAVGDGKTDNTAVLQKAIDGLPQGGTLLLTAGHYRSGSLRLKSHMRLHLDAGALLQAPDEHTKILPIPGWPSAIAFLTGSNIENLSITGAGTIDGNGYVVRKAYESALGLKKQPGRLLYLGKSKNITIRGVTLRDSYSWNVQMTQCDHVSIAWIKVLSDVRLSNHDGIDLVGCSEVAVSDSFLFTEDDGISPKAAEDREISENHVYRNLVIWAHKANGIRVGSESRCRVMRNFLFEDIHLLNCANAIRLDTFEGATYEDFTFRRIWMEDFLQTYDERYERNRERRMVEDRSYAISFLVTRQKATPLGAIRRITFEEVHWNDPQITVRFEVPDWILKGRKEAQMESLISDIVFRKCTVAGKPVAAGAGIGLRPNDGVVSSGVIFEP